MYLDLFFSDDKFFHFRSFNRQFIPCKKVVYRANAVGLPDTLMM